MALVGRRREMAQAGRLLESAAGGRGGVVVVTGPPGSGRTELAAALVREGVRSGFDVLRTAALRGQPGRLVWARLLRDAGAPEELAARALGEPGSLDLDEVARALTAGGRRLLVIDDIDHGGPQALQMLQAVAARAAVRSTAVVVTTVLPLGFGTEVRLGGLTEGELAVVAGGVPPQARRALWLASGGLPGPALSLAADLAERGAGVDPLVYLALHAPSRAEFLDVDAGLVRLLESAIARDSGGAATRSRLLARLARELLGDASAGARRRALADEALKLARDAGDPRALAEVLDARLHALWDPAGAEDRLAAASEIIELAREAGDHARGRSGLFWRFVALMELARVGDAESALAAFEREAIAAGDGEAMVMAAARHAMLATLRGRFGEAARLIDDVTDAGHRVGLADTDRLAAALRGEMAFLLGPETAPFGADQLLLLARRLPGHHLEATAAAWLLVLGREPEAIAELDRLLPGVLAGSGPRWLGAAAALAFVAGRTGDKQAAVHLYEAIRPYRGRLVLHGGANTCLGPAGYFLGPLAARLGRLDEAAEHLQEALALATRIGALPAQALILEALAEVLSQRQATGDLEAASAHRDRARAIAERLGMAPLLARLAPPADEWTLGRDGEDWLLQAGPERARLRDSRGLHYLRALLAAPGQDIRALDLAAKGPGLVPAAAGPVLDVTARDAYRRRLRELDAELDAADRSGDRAAAERATAERQSLLRELRRATGLAGRPRVASAEAERARVNVTRTLGAALDRIAASAPQAAVHLRASIRTGAACRYQPAPGGPARWHL